MQAPKQRQNRSRTRRRRGGHGVLKAKVFVKCSKCDQPIMPHRACPFCGTYKNREVVNTAKSVENKAKKPK